MLAAIVATFFVISARIIWKVHEFFLSLQPTSGSAGVLARNGESPRILPIFAANSGSAGVLARNGVSHHQSGYGEEEWRNCFCKLYLLACL